MSRASEDLYEGVLEALEESYCPRNSSSQERTPESKTVGKGHSMSASGEVDDYFGEESQEDASGKKSRFENTTMISSSP